MSRLDKLLKPRSIAVIGGREAERVIYQALAMGFDGDIWPVHPVKKNICGLPCYSTVTSLPGSPDLAYIAVNRHRTIDILAELSAVGAGGAICYASGFGEADAEGQKLQHDLLQAAGDMPVIGPNCYGFLNYADAIALWPDQHGGETLPADHRGVGIVTQSSNIAINLTMQKRGLPIAYMMTAGNQAQTGLSEMALALLDDERVSVVGLHVEAFDSITGMEAVARKSRLLKKPVIVLKIGRSEQAREAAFTHTASMAGADDACDAFLKRIGIARTNSLPGFLETLKLLHVVGPLDGYEISCLSCSGGEAALVADAANGMKINFKEMSQEEKQPVEKALGSLVTVSNPLDYHTYIWGDGEGMETTFTSMMQVGFDLTCLVMDFPRQDRCTLDDWKVPREAWFAAAQKTNAKTCLIATLPENLTETTAKELIAFGIAPLVGIDDAMEAIELAANIGKSWQQELFSPLAMPGELDLASQCILNEAEGKTLLSQSGVNVPTGASLDRSDCLESLANRIGYPVVLKTLGIAHKSEHNGVRLNLQNSQSLTAAAKELFKLSDQLYLESMVEKPVLELLVGIVHDQQMGLVMTIATGGVMVEVFNDSQTLLLPFNIRDVELALRNLKSAKLFTGFRGRTKADFDAAVEAIMKIMDFALANKNQLSELEINPLIVCEHGYGAIASDVLVKFGSRKND